MGVLWRFLEVRGLGTDEGGGGRRGREGIELGEGLEGGSTGGRLDSSAGDRLKQRHCWGKEMIFRHAMPLLEMVNCCQDPSISPSGAQTYTRLVL